MTALYSAALTRAQRQAMFGVAGKSTGREFPWQGHILRDNDTAPESDRRVDIYDPGNQLRGLAPGGIVNKRVLSWLGEKGSEAVIPLDRASRQLSGLMGGHTFNNSFSVNNAQRARITTTSTTTNERA